MFLHVSHSVDVTKDLGPFCEEPKSKVGVPGVELRMENTCCETEEKSGTKVHDTHGPSETVGFGAGHERER